MNETAMVELLLGEFHQKLRSLEVMIDRDAVVPAIKDKIKVIMGMRRSGKTYFCFQNIKQLLASGIPLKQILYLNFEDDRLLPLSQEKLANLLEAFYKLYPENHEHECYIFLDEIQVVPDWPTVIRRFYDTKNIQIFLTGSSAKLLSKEIATNLRGRSLAIEMWPYSFTEYLQAKQITIDTKIFDQKNQDKLMKVFTEYLNTGGFPEVVNYPNDIRLKTLQEYLDVVIYRDIIERHKVKHPILLKYMIVFMVNNIGRPFTINKFYQDIKSQGYKITKDSLYEYAEFIEDTYLAFMIDLYDQSIRKVQTNPRKIFAIDPGLVSSLALNQSSKINQLFENVIYLDLRRQGFKVFYYLTKDRYEIDFVVQAISGETKLLQVCWDHDDASTYERETRALEAAKKELSLEGKIITLAQYLKEGLII